jgi:hypothetical protein
MKSFKFVFRYTDRDAGPKDIPIDVQASGFPTALAAAGRTFWKTINDRKQHFDAMNHGVSITMASVGKEAEPAKATKVTEATRFLE